MSEKFTELNLKLDNLQKVVNLIANKVSAIDPSSELITVAEASRLTGYSGVTLRKKKDMGIIPFIQKGRGHKLLFNKAALMAWHLNSKQS